MYDRVEFSKQKFTPIKEINFAAVFFILFFFIRLTKRTEAARKGERVLMIAVGQQARFSCRTNHSTPVEWWYRESYNSSTKIHIFADGNFTLSYRDRVRSTDIATTAENYDFILQHVRGSDQGYYVCAEDVGFGEQHHYRLVISDYVAAEVGSAVVLHCYSAKTDVEWHFQSSSQADSLNVYSNGFIYDRFKDRFALSKSSDVDFNLEVKEISEHDSGNYTCIEDGDFANDRHTVRVIVYRVASIGETVTLSCWTKYNVPVSWWYMGKTTGDRDVIYIYSIISKAYSDRFTVHAASDGYYNLTIRNVEQSDYGFYVCLEKNGEKDRHFIELRKREPNVASERSTTAVFGSSTRMPDVVASSTFSSEGDCSAVASSTMDIYKGVISSLLIVSTILSACLFIACRRNRELLKNAQQQQQRPEAVSLTL